MEAIVWLSLFLLAPAPTADTKEGLYFESMRRLQKKQYAAATRSFRKLRALLQREQAHKKKGTRPWHMLDLGQCDAMLYLAEIHWTQKRKQAACRTRQQIAKKLQGLPKAWKRWNTNKSLKRRLLANQKILTGPCAAVPSHLVLKRQPPQAQIFLKLPSGKWKELKGARHPVLQTTLALKADAPGHRPRTLKVQVPRWQEKTVVVTLTLAPPQIIVVVPRRRKPPQRPKPQPLPVTQKWWFWTLVGVGVVGVGVTATAIGVSLAERNHVFRGHEGDAYKLW